MLHYRVGQLSFLMLICLNVLYCRKIELIENGVDSGANNLPCFIIQTSTAAYYLEKSGGGLSSLLDIDGNDWIGFSPTNGSGTAGEYRGFPNAVHLQDGNFFHPLNANTDSSALIIDYVSEGRVTIIGTSGNSAWQNRWDFYDTHCTFTMTQIPAGFKYWILYEGTPGGDYNDSDWWMTSNDSSKTPLTIDHNGDIPHPEWIVFGDAIKERCLFLYNHLDDEYDDSFYQMQKKMTVFGFGRKGIEKYLNAVPASFSIGFLETTDHSDISRILKTLFFTNQK